MKETIKEITYNELLQLSQRLRGKQTEVAISINNPSEIFSTNNYHWFDAKNSEETLQFYDRDKTLPQQLQIQKENISKIIFSSGENTVYDLTFSIILNDDSRIDFCVSESPVTCHKCHILIDELTPSWQINQQGNYGSQWDGENVKINLCEGCLLEFLGYKETVYQ